MFSFCESLTGLWERKGGGLEEVLGESLHLQQLAQENPFFGVASE